MEAFGKQFVGARVADEAGVELDRRAEVAAVGVDQPVRETHTSEKWEGQLSGPGDCSVIEGARTCVDAIQQPTHFREVGVPKRGLEESCS